LRENGNACGVVSGVKNGRCTFFADTNVTVFPHAYIAILELLSLILWKGWLVGWWAVPDRAATSDM
jgi:hypothetical protein